MGEQPHTDFETRVLADLHTLITTTNAILTTTNDLNTRLSNLETHVTQIRRRIYNAIIEFQDNPPSSGRGDHDPAGGPAQGEGADEGEHT